MNNVGIGLGWVNEFGSRGQVILFPDGNNSLDDNAKTDLAQQPLYGNVYNIRICNIPLTICPIVRRGKLGFHEYLPANARLNIVMS